MAAANRSIQQLAAELRDHEDQRVRTLATAMAEATSAPNKTVAEVFHLPGRRRGGDPHAAARCRRDKMFRALSRAERYADAVDVADAMVRDFRRFQTRHRAPRDEVEEMIARALGEGCGFPGA